MELIVILALGLLWSFTEWRNLKLRGSLKKSQLAAGLTESILQISASSLKAQHDTALQLSDVAEEAVELLHVADLLLANSTPGAFSNGVRHNGLDEGDVKAQEIHDEIAAFVQKHRGPQ